MEEIWKDIKGYSVVEVAKKLNVGRDFVTDVLKIFDKI